MINRMCRGLRTSVVGFMLAAILGTPLATAADAQTQRRIVFDNRCNAPIRLLVRHADGYRNWHIHGWYDLDPHEVTGLTSNGTRLTQSDNHTLYFYAESSDNRGYLWNGDHNEEWRGTTYGFRAARVVAEGNLLRTRITCDN